MRSAAVKRSDATVLMYDNKLGRAYFAAENAMKPCLVPPNDWVMKRGAFLLAATKQFKLGWANAQIPTIGAISRRKMANFLGKLAHFFIRHYSRNSNYAGGGGKAKRRHSADV